MTSIPNPANFCGGAFPDWLEVNLTDKCNARCSWCIERKGWHPSHHATWKEMADAAIATGRRNIILLGGEPLLYRDLACLVERLTRAGRDVWITTNGSLLTADFVNQRLTCVRGVNISIHHHDLLCNKTITGVKLNFHALRRAVAALQLRHAAVRLNCNCIAGQVDSANRIREYVKFASQLGVDKVRFAELKDNIGGFVDLAAILDHKYGLNDNPFADGCNSDAVIDGMPVNFRQMCGLQTTRRPSPDDPQQVVKKVLYYDGKLYDGWQTLRGAKQMKDKELLDLLEKLEAGKLSVAEVALAIERDKPKEKKPRTETPDRTTGTGCQY